MPLQIEETESWKERRCKIWMVSIALVIWLQTPLNACILLD
jgi:hypothetical protein